MADGYPVNDKVCLMPISHVMNIIGGKEALMIQAHM
jgi:hypothetical protein